MGAIAQAAFDPKPRRLGAVLNMIAGQAILAGDVVGIHGTGVEMTVWKHVTGTTVAPIGVALHSQATAGQKIAIASIGSIVKVKNALDSAALEAGTQIMGSGTTAGHVIAYSSATGGEEPLGYMLEALPATAVPAYAYITGSVKLTKK
jgi:hypothetical protein